MVIYEVVRPKDIVYVSIIQRIENNKYSFVNLTKNHICKCQFNTIEDALNDMDNYIKLGKVISYKQIDFSLDNAIKSPHFTKGEIL